MSFELNLINEALAELEKGFEIQDINDVSPTALTAKSCYMSAFRWLYGQTRWSFLIKKRVLTNEVTLDVKNPSFNYAFSFPEDFGRLIEASKTDIFGTTYIYDYVLTEPYVDLTIFGREGNFIFSNFKPVYIVYQSQNREQLQFAPLDVIEAFKLKMQSKLAWSLHQNRLRSEELKNEALVQCRLAQDNNYFEAERYVQNRDKFQEQEFSKMGT